MARVALCHTLRRCIEAMVVSFAEWAPEVVGLCLQLCSIEALDDIVVNKRG